MIHLLLLFSFLHTSHQKQFIAATLSELRHAASVVGDYEANPPIYTASAADEVYVTRAEADISVALGELKRYQHHHAAEEDVRSAVSQLQRDLEDIPPAHWPQDVTSKI